MMSNELDMSQLNELSEQEKSMVMLILGEMSDKGYSLTFDDLLYDDYAEIPVDITTFLHDPLYLGKGLTSEDGKFTVFPYWEDVLNKVFPNNVDTAYNTLILSGAIGLGKSFVAVIAMLYLLYRMLCLKNPYEHYGLQPIDHITFSLMNITMDAAKGVAWSKIQELLQMSPWFMMHGHVSKSLNPEWQPSQNIELIYGSQPRHVIGRAVFCLDGDTEIRTPDGFIKLKDLENKDIQVYSLNENNEEILSDICTVQPTIESDEEYQITLDNDYVIKCTPNHRLMLKDGSYKEAQYLTIDDELAETNISYNDYINDIISKRGQWDIPENVYFEVHHIIPKCLGGKGNISHSNKRLQHHPNLIHLYPQEHFIAHKLLALENPNNTSLVKAWSMMAYPKGKTKRDYPISPEDYAILRELNARIGRLTCALLDENGHPWNYNRTNVYSEELLNHMRHERPLMKNVPKSLETRLKMSEAALRRHAEHPESHVVGNKDMIAISNNSKDSVKYVAKNSVIPEGWYVGNCKTEGKHNMSNYTEEMRQHRRDISKGENNNMYGKGYKIAGGNNGKAIYAYTFEGVNFDCRNDLIDYLKLKNIDISKSAIRRIMSGSYTKRIADKYQYVIDNLTWRLKKDENTIN